MYSMGGTLAYGILTGQLQEMKVINQKVRFA